jgi:hypothetical protein
VLRILTAPDLQREAHDEIQTYSTTQWAHCADTAQRAVDTEKRKPLGLASLPAQDVEVMVNNGLGPPVKGRYTIRNIRPELGEIDVDVVVHEHGGPGSRWAERAEIGSQVAAIWSRSHPVTSAGSCEMACPLTRQTCFSRRWTKSPCRL